MDDQPGLLDSRIRELVAELDTAAPLRGADVIAFIEPFWQTFPKVAKQEHDVFVLATPAGFIRLGLEFMKAGISPPLATRRDGEEVALDLDHLLRQDSNFENFGCERLPTSSPHHDGGPSAFDWQVGDLDHPGLVPPLEELDRRVAAAWGEFMLSVPRDRFPQIEVRATANGFLRFGLEVAKGGFVPATKKGRNRGEVVSLDLADLLDHRSEIQFHWERVGTLPEGGDRRRSHGISCLPVASVVGAILLTALVRSC